MITGHPETKPLAQTEHFLLSFSEVALKYRKNFILQAFFYIFCTFNALCSLSLIFPSVVAKVKQVRRALALPLVEVFGDFCENGFVEVLQLTVLQAQLAAHTGGKFHIVGCNQRR